MLDIGIAVLGAFVMLVTAYLGVHVTLHPAQTDKHKLAYKLGFGVCALLSCGLIGTQAYRNNKTQAGLQAAIDRIEKNTKESPKVIVNIPPIVMPAPIVQQVASLAPKPGNLRDRAARLSADISSYIRMRESVLESFYQQQKPGANRWDVYGPWTTSTSGGFKNIYLSRVRSVRNECANLHIIDTELDKEMQLIMQLERIPGNANQKGESDFIPNPDSIKKIAERLAVLATQIN